MCQISLPANEYSTVYPVILQPPSYGELLHVTVVWAPSANMHGLPFGGSGGPKMQ